MQSAQETRKKKKTKTPRRDIWLAENEFVDESIRFIVK